ncbi:hypothetical protein AB4Z34_29215 [Ensifer sp. 2YAB10]|uniref:hypothetical protein n=1 Tax=unclassified Ensifer TaxID=2633371 RepID=UPI003F8F4F6A
MLWPPQHDYVLLATMSKYVVDGFMRSLKGLVCGSSFRATSKFDKGPRLFRGGRQHREYVLSLEKIGEIVVRIALAEIDVRDERFLQKAMKWQRPIPSRPSWTLTGRPGGRYDSLPQRQ